MVLDKFGRIIGKGVKGVAGGELEVIKWPEHLDPEQYIAWRYPKDEIRLGSVAIIDEAQKALFFRDGKLMGVLDSGRHTLTTQNVPFLQGLVTEIYGGESIFKASVVFVNLKQYWLEFGDRFFVDYVGVHMTYQVQAFYTVDENKLELFYVRLMGSKEELLKDYVDQTLKSFIQSRLVEAFAEYATEQARAGRMVQNLSDFMAMISEFGEVAKAKIAQSVNETFGLRLTQINISRMDVAEEDKPILQMSGPRAFAAMYQRDWVGRERIAQSLGQSPASGAVAPFIMFPWMMYPPQPPQQPPQPGMTPPAQPGQQPPPGQPPGYPPRPPYPPGYPPYPYPYPAPYAYQQPPPPSQQPQQYPPRPQQQAMPGHPQQVQYPMPQQPYQQPGGVAGPVTQFPQPGMVQSTAKCPSCGRDIPALSPVCPYCAAKLKWCPNGRPVLENQSCQ